MTYLKTLINNKPSYSFKAIADKRCRALRLVTSSAIFAKSISTMKADDVNGGDQNDQGKFMKQLNNYIIVDVGANLTNKKFSRDLDAVIQRAKDSGKKPHALVFEISILNIGYIDPKANPSIFFYFDFRCYKTNGYWNFIDVIA